MLQDSNVKPVTDAMDDDGELTVEALDRVTGGADPSNSSKILAINSAKFPFAP